MENLVTSTNKKLETIIDELLELKINYEEQIKGIEKEIKDEYDKVDAYKKEFNDAKKKIEKMTDDINGFEEDYKNLVEKFSDDELSNILIAANKEISAKIDERKKKILDDKNAMGILVNKAKIVKRKLVKLNSLKNSLETSLEEITASYEYFKESLEDVIKNSKDLKKKKESKVIKPVKKTKKLEKEIIEESKVDEEDIKVEEEIKKDIKIEIDNIKKEKITEDISIEENDDIEDNDSNLEDILNFDDSLEEQ